jgi:hypothetical protein
MVEQRLAVLFLFEAVLLRLLFSIRLEEEEAEPRGFDRKEGNEGALEDS